MKGPDRPRKCGRLTRALFNAFGELCKVHNPHET